MFKTSHITSMFVSRGRTQALETWRDAAGLVRLRWWAFLEADAAGRSRAFAAYVAALDAEEAAAAEIAMLSDMAA
jgi:hypothetical protein